MWQIDDATVPATSLMRDDAPKQAVVAATEKTKKQDVLNLESIHFEPHKLCKPCLPESQQRSAKKRSFNYFSTMACANGVGAVRKFIQ